MRNFMVWVVGHRSDAQIVTAKTRSKARYAYWLDISDVCDIPYTSMRSRVTDRETKAESLERRCGQWNQRAPVGTPVRYWPGLREGEGKSSWTRSPAIVMCDHLSVWVDGYASCINISHVEVTGGAP